MDMYTPVRSPFRGLKTDAEVFAFAQNPATSLDDLLELLDYTYDHQMFKMITERPEVKHWMRTHANAIVWFQKNRFFRTSLMDDVFLNPHMPDVTKGYLSDASPGNIMRSNPSLEDLATIILYTQAYGLTGMYDGLIKHIDVVDLLA